MRRLLSSLCLLLLGTLPLVLLAAPPNVVFLLADDLGIGDVKCYGGERCLVETPAFDRLAREGMRFTDAHAVASVCVPSRVAIMTGRYPWRLKAVEAGGPWGFLGLRFAPNHFTLGDLFSAAGYRTGYVGKWHLGTRMETLDGQAQGPTNANYRRPLRVGPRDYGFSESFILPGSLDMYPYAFVKNHQWEGEVTEQRGWSAFHRVGPTAKGFEDWQVLERWASESEKFFEESALTEQPFFLVVGLTSPHTPTSPSPAFEGKSSLGVYGDFVMETDHVLGRVLEALERHDLAEDTLVVATSDHGPAPYAGRLRRSTPGQMRGLEAEGHFSRGPYRGYKFSVYEGGLRVPFMVRWPGVVPAQTRCDRLVGLNDMMRTFAEVVGMNAVSATVRGDSVSLMPLFRDPFHAPVRENLVMNSPRAFAFREGRWKLALCPGSGSHLHYGNTPRAQAAWREAVAALGREPERAELRRAPFVQLYDMEEDPQERNDLAAAQPERVEALLQKFERIVARGRSTPGPVLKNEVPDLRILARRPPGRP